MLMATNHLKRAKVYLAKNARDTDDPSGKNFHNGFRVFSENKLYPHSSDRWVTDISSTQFDPEAKLSFYLQKSNRNVWWSRY